jgi:phage gpG-like protein
MAFDFDKKLKEFERLKVTLPKLISNDGQRYFLKNFDKEQWQGQHWTTRRDHTNRRKLLVKTGALRRAVSNARREARFDRIRFEVFVQSKKGFNYAQVHNEGGVIRKSGGKRTIGFRMKRGNLVFAKKGKATFEQDVNIGAHTIVIPKRQFLGRNRDFDKLLKGRVDSEIKKLMR